jgi:hypothetical protein
MERWCADIEGESNYTTDLHKLTYRLEILPPPPQTPFSFFDTRGSGNRGQPGINDALELPI